MASSRGHQLWMDVMNDISHSAEHGWCKRDNGMIDVLSSTGPRRLEKWVSNTKYEACVHVLKSNEFFFGDSGRAGGFAFHHNHASWTRYSAGVARRKIQYALDVFSGGSSCGCSTQQCAVGGFIC